VCLPPEQFHRYRRWNWLLAFVKRYAEKARKQISRIDKNTLKLCQSYHWPGNSRELQNIVERSVILCTGDTFWIDEAWLSSQNASRLESSGPLTQNLQNYERELITDRSGSCGKRGKGCRAKWSGCQTRNSAIYVKFEDQTGQYKEKHPPAGPLIQLSEF
jgi:transcriptional regulator of acetoin/glycerol metabolism